jgi:hypothetical protein
MGFVCGDSWAALSKLESDVIKVRSVLVVCFNHKAEEKYTASPPLRKYFPINAFILERSSS